MLEIDNQRLNNENDQLKQTHNYEESFLREKLLQRSNVIIHKFIHFFLSIDLFSSNNHYLINVIIKQFSNQKLKFLKMILIFINIVLNNRFHILIYQ
jgi:hypothetical protein